MLLPLYSPKQYLSIPLQLVLDLNAKELMIDIWKSRVVILNEY